MLNIDFVSGLFSSPGFWLPFILAAVLAAALVLLVAVLFGKKRPDFSVYEKRAYLFDTRSEFDLFNILQNLYSDTYYVFPQVHYSHLVEVKKSLPYRERMGYWSRTNKKSADFVLCDKERVVPQLVIELDGSSHNQPDRQERDAFVDELMSVAGLPILHLKPENMSKDFVKEEVDKKLTSQ